jgi:hypothetical protein
MNLFNKNAILPAIVIPKPTVALKPSLDTFHILLAPHFLSPYAPRLELLFFLFLPLYGWHIRSENECIWRVPRMGLIALEAKPSARILLWMNYFLFSQGDWRREMTSPNPFHSWNLKKDGKGFVTMVHPGLFYLLLRILHSVKPY